MKDHYDTLGVPRNASTETIKAAYRALARKCHPDVNKAADAGRKFQELNEAYHTLSDPEQRAVYSAQLRAAELAQVDPEHLEITDLVMSEYSVLGPVRRKKKSMKKKAAPKPKQPVAKKAQVWTGDVPDGVIPDESLGGLF